MSCNHRKFNSAEVLRWIKDKRFDNPLFCTTSGNTLIIQRANRSGSTVYEFTWNNSKTPIDDPQLTKTAWGFGIEESDIPDAEFYADDETEAEIEAIEEAEAE